MNMSQSFARTSLIMLAIVMVMPQAAFGHAADPEQPETSLGIPDLASLLQQPSIVARSDAQKQDESTSAPHVIGLRRESVPIYRRGKIASFKTSYSGILAVGNPPQEFRVVFDTGSGNIVLPAAECKSEACLVEDRRRFNMSASTTAVAIQTDSTPVKPGEESDQVTIGFGTGEITGEFTRDTVCFGVHPKEFVEKELTEEDLKVPVALSIGSSAGDRKCTTSKVPVECAPDAGNLGKRTNSERDSDTFSITVTGGTEVCAQRTDADESGWGMDLQISCFEKAIFFAPSLLSQDATEAEKNPSWFSYFFKDPKESEGNKETMNSSALVSQAVVSKATKLVPPDDALCVEMSVILAVEMSTQPFKTFRFDGILGLGLEGLTMHKTFSAVDMLINRGKVSASHFGVYLTDGEDADDSEIAMGGVNDKRFLEPLSYQAVTMADLGYWLINIKAIRVGGVELDMCKDGQCRGVVDTGTSHLGVPAPYDGELADLLTTEAGDMVDCRLAIAPEIEIELDGRNITLHPFNYMRRLPLREGVSVSSAQGVYIPSAETDATLGAPSSADAPGVKKYETSNDTSVTPVVPASESTGFEAAPPSTNNVVPAAGTNDGATTPMPDILVLADLEKQAVDKEARVPQHSTASTAGSGGDAPQPVADPAAAPAAESAPLVDPASTPADPAASPAEEPEEAPRRFCRPRLMPVRLPAPLGPKLFILGEPVLHRYYTVYDWGNKRVGFSLANNHWNTMDPSEITDRKGVLPKEVDMLLMQKSNTARTSARRLTGTAAQSGGMDETLLVQVTVKLTVRRYGDLRRR